MSILFCSSICYTAVQKKATAQSILLDVCAIELHYTDVFLLWSILNFCNLTEEFFRKSDCEVSAGDTLETQAAGCRALCITDGGWRTSTTPPVKHRSIIVSSSDAQE